MSNPARAPTEPTAFQLALGFVENASVDMAKAVETAGKYKDLKVIVPLLEGLDMEKARTIALPKDYRPVNAVGDVYARAKTGKPVARVSQVTAKQIQVRVIKRIPGYSFYKGNPTPPASHGLPLGLTRQGVLASCFDKVFVYGGTEGSMGRVLRAYPKKGASPYGRITRPEARVALASCGLVDRTAQPKVSFPLVGAPGDPNTLKVNPKSSNGFPVLGRWEDPGLAQKCVDLAVSAYAEMSKLGNAEKWLRDAEQGRPWLVALMGKAKEDYYAPEKVETALLRFYNCFPRQMMLIMQTVTQPFEQRAENILEDSDLHTGQGVSLPHGGAHRLVEALQHQLDESGRAFVHLGDDSWVIFRVGDRLVQFALDCSNFDLTQHASVTEQVHRAVQEELREYDPVAADLWYAYARERVVVTVGNATYRWKHAGPSGMPLQSKVNDMLMDVMIRRVLGRLQFAEDADAARIEEGVANAVEGVARDMGFVAKLEQFSCRTASSLQSALEDTPFLFIGHYFWSERKDKHKDPKVLVCCDVARSLAQLPYPTVKWMAKGKHLDVREAMRIGSIAMGRGIAPLPLQEAFEEWKEAAIEVVEGALDQYGDASAEELRWALQDDPAGPDLVPSLAGLLRVLKRPPAEDYAFWADPRQPEPAEAPPTLANWADEVEATERRLGVPAAAPLPRARPLPQGRVPTHPVTLENVGRPPPTAVWGPDRPPRPPREVYESSGRVGVRTVRRNGVLYEAASSSDDEAFWEEQRQLAMEEMFDEELEKFDYSD